MIKDIFFKLVDLILVFKKDGKLYEGSYTDGTKYTVYRMSGTKYTCVGIKNPESTPPGFFMPIKEAICEGEVVTKTFKHFAGPKCIHVPDTGYIFRKPVMGVNFLFKWPKLSLVVSRQYKKGPSKIIKASNLLNQLSEYGAK